MDHLAAQIWKTLTMKPAKRRGPFPFLVFATTLVVSLPLTWAHATMKGFSQIVTPDLQGDGDLSLSLQIQDKRIANPFELQAELGLTKWSEERCFAGSNG